MFEKKKKEDILYEMICEVVAGITQNVVYKEKERKVLLTVNVDTEKYDMSICVNEEKELISFFALFPHTVSADIADIFARELSFYNYETFFRGGYQYNYKLEKVIFQDSLPYNQVEVNKSGIEATLRYVIQSVENSNPSIYDFMKKLEATAVREVSMTEADEVMEKIDSMVGWDEYRALCHEIYDVAPMINRCELQSSFSFQNFLFSVDEGCGLTNAIDNLLELTKALGLMTKAKDGRRYEEMVLSSEEMAGKWTLSEAFDVMSKSDNYNILICFDISEFIEKSKHIELKDFLKKITRFEENYMYVFRVPYLEEKSLDEIRKLLADVFYIRSVTVQPFDNEQLKEVAVSQLNKYGYTMQDDAWFLFFARVAEEKSDGHFYGMRSVEKIAQEILWEKCKKESEKSRENDKYEISRSISESDICSIASIDGNPHMDGYEKLKDMIGMDGIAERIREIVAQLEVSKNQNDLEHPCIHMRFTGAPGTGKTTVARILGQILKEKGVLRNGYFFEHSARDLCGSYVGQTAPKTSAICRDAYGSVLFIDEAYALYQGEGGDNKDYGREALTTLISEMENHREDMVVIMAGYTDEMDTLMQANTGLRSRMPYVIEFKSYTREQLTDIFMHFVNKHFRYGANFEETVREYFNSLSDGYIESKEFANARFVRNLYERTWSKAALRCSMQKMKDVVLTREDFLSASSEKEFSEKLMIKKHIGF